MESNRIHQSFALRLPASMKDKAAAIAQEDGVSLNHFISIALAEKLTRVEQRKMAELGSSSPRQLNGHSILRHDRESHLAKLLYRVP